VGLALVPLSASAIALVFFVRGEYQPPGDFATIELHTRDTFNHPPLTGLYSREEWHHPGPTFFYVLAVPYRMLGSTAVAMNVAALLVNGASITAMAWLARRRGGTPLMLVLLVGVGLFVHGAGVEFMRSPWNPVLTVLPYALLILLTWSALCGDTWAFPAAAGVASFLAQTHIGYVVLALPLLALSGAGLGWAAWRDAHTRRGARRDALIGAGVLAVAWLPPVIDQLANSPGNLSLAFDYFRRPDQETRTFAEGLRVVLGEFAWIPEWTRGIVRSPVLFGEHPFAYDAPRPVLLVPFIAVGVYLIWRGRPAARLLYATVLIAMVLGIVAVMRTVGLLLAYRLQWTWVIAMLAITLVAWTGWTLLAGRWPWLHARVLVPVALSALALLAVVNTVDVVRAGTPVAIAEFPETMQSLNDQLLPQIPDGPGVVLIRNPTADFFWLPGVVIALERRGIPVKVQGDTVNLLGSHRTFRDERVRTALTIEVTHGEPETPDGTRRIALWTECPLDDMIRDGAAHRRLEEQHAAGEISDVDLVNAKLELCPQYAAAVYEDIEPP
jgi:uncharacterized membrane protein